MEVLESVNGIIWGVPALVLIVCVGVCICIKCRFPQLLMLPEALAHFASQFKEKKNTNGTSGYQALCTALAATVGTGNLIGVAGAIVIGGPGAIFWMWVFGFLGMGVKFAEVTLAVRFRTVNKQREFVGGPMYIIQNGLPKCFHWLATVYCILGIGASFGVGNAAQVNAVVMGMKSAFGCFNVAFTREMRLIIGIILAVLVCSVLLGGAKRIGNVAEKIVPVAAAGYICLCLLVIVFRGDVLPKALLAIVQGAFMPESVTGGVVGSAFLAMRIGASRGTFTNEAGMGTASIAHAGANCEPVKQGLMGIVEVFIDTIVICTLTALVVLCSGVPITYGFGDGAELTVDAFSFVLGSWIEFPLALTIICFAVATILGWSLYGIRCAQYLFGDGSWRNFAILQSAAVVFAALAETKTAWLFSEIMNGMMLIPNMISLFALLTVVCYEQQGYKNRTRLKTVPCSRVLF